MNINIYDHAKADLILEENSIFKSTKDKVECLCCHKWITKIHFKAHRRSWKHEMRLRMHCYDMGFTRACDKRRNNQSIKTIQLYGSNETNSKYATGIRRFFEETKAKAADDLTELAFHKYFQSPRQSYEYYAVKQLYLSNDIRLNWDIYRNRPKLQQNSNEHVYHKEEEILNLINIALKSLEKKKQEMAVQLGFLYYEGARIQDLSNITLKDLQEKVQISWSENKTKKKRTDHRPDQLKLIVDEAKIQNKDQNLLFGLTLNYVRTLLIEFASENGVKNFQPHNLRKSRAIELYSQGVDLYTIQTWLGHKSARTTEIYLKKSREQARDQISLVTKKRFKENEKLLLRI